MTLASIDRRVRLAEFFGAFFIYLFIYWFFVWFSRLNYGSIIYIHQAGGRMRRTDVIIGHCRGGCCQRQQVFHVFFLFFVAAVVERLKNEKPKYFTEKK